MLDQIRRDIYKFIFKTKIKTSTSTFKRYVFKHVMYKKKELRKKWSSINHRKIKKNKFFRKFFLKKFVKYAYYIPINKKLFISMNRKPALASLKYYKNIDLFKNFVYRFGKFRLEAFAKEQYLSFMFRSKNKYRFFPKKLPLKYKIVYYTTNKGIKKKKYKIKRRYLRRFSRSFKARNFVFQELIFRSRRARLRRRTYVLTLHKKFQFVLHKFIKKIKINVYKILFFKILNIYFVLNKLFYKLIKIINSFVLKNLGENKESKFYFFTLVCLYNRKIKLYNLFKKGLIKFNVNKFKIDLAFSKMSCFYSDIGFLKYNKWNLQLKMVNCLQKIFKGFFFKVQFHFSNMRSVSALVISHYISVKLKQKYRLAPILKDVKRFCNFSKQVRGWKVSCAGRFSKKEIASFIVQKGGAFGYSSITSLLDYSFSSAILKYSICGIKVWLVSRKNFKKVNKFQYKFIKVIKQKKMGKKNEKKKVKFFKIYKKKNIIFTENFKSIEKFIKTMKIFNYKNLFYKKRFKKTKGFWSMWKIYFRNYHFLI